MEQWDVRSREGIPTGRLHTRGTPLGPEQYQLVVYVWILAPDGRILITQRNAGRKNPLKWEYTGGSVLAGETSLEGALREVLEETGIRLDPGNGQKVHQYVAGQSLIDVWLFHHDVDLSITRAQPDEVADIRLVDRDTLLAMYERGEMLAGLAYFAEWAWQGCV